MWKYILCAFVSVTLARQMPFDNYKVYRVVPETESHLQVLRQLEEVALENGCNFWTEPGFVNSTVDIMVSPEKSDDFANLMNSSNIKYNTFIENVQTLIDAERPKKRERSGFGWNRYHELSEIYEYLESLARLYPNHVRVIVGGQTYQGRPIKGVHVSFKAGNPGVFLEGGIHAREWVSTATVTFILNALLTSADPRVRAMAERHDWYIFPVFNPDGYTFTHSSPQNRLWRKTLKPYVSPFGFTCYGTDPNRNWGFKWNQGGSSSNPCQETFAGSGPFSDVETRTLSQYITSISDKFYAYLSFHSYSQLLLFPYGHTKQPLDNYDDEMRIGRKVTAALAQRYGTKYKVGNVAEAIYVATGSSVDWVKAKFRTPITYIYELRDRGYYGFILPPAFIVPTAQETLDSLVAMFEEAKVLGYPRK